MSKGTIIYIGGFELPDKNAAAHRVLGNAELIRIFDYDVVLIDVNKKITEGIIDKPQKVKGFEYYSIPYPKSNKQWLEFLIDISSFKEIASKYNDVKAVICYNYQAGAFVKLNKFCKEKDIKVIADCTEWYEPTGKIVFRTLKKLDTFLRMRIIQPRVDGVIAISNYLYDYYSSKMETVLLLPPLVNLDDKKWRSETRYDKDDTKINMIYVGLPGVGGKDQLNKIMDILSRYNKNHKSNFVFRIIGITLEQYCINFKTNGLPTNLNDRVIFEGKVSHIDALNAIIDADFLFFIRDVSLVTTAGFPTKFVESISCGTPVITSKTSDLEYYIKDGKNGFFVDINDEIATMEKMSEIFSLKKEQISQMKKDCYKAKMFDYRSYENEMRIFLNKVEL